MSGQVVFLPGWRQVSDEEMVLRYTWQEEMTLAHIEFYQAFRHLAPDEYKEKKEEIYRRARQAITLVSSRQSQH